MLVTFIIITNPLIWQANADINMYMITHVLCL